MNISRSLLDIIHKEYVDSVCRAQSFLTRKPVDLYYKIAKEKVDFFPASIQTRLEELVTHVGKKVTSGLEHSLSGAGTQAFEDSSHYFMAPLAGMGPYRIGEDGRLYLASKSAHYHASLGHRFPGFNLIENAKKLGIVQSTHNNTRGYVTRLAETELIRRVNGIGNDNDQLRKIFTSTSPGVLNRVINLQTGSLAVEAAFKILLTRFYPFSPSDPKPQYSGTTPVLLVMGDSNGGLEVNYHGTTIFTQMFRGLWPSLYKELEKSNLFKIVPVRVNDIDHFKETVKNYETGNMKIAGFMHEIILMNYGAIKLDETYLKEAYSICRQHDIPIVADEIQSCTWYGNGFLFKEYELNPDIVVVGKGFPGGEYAASKVILSSDFDNLDQFGALVTNGQEELSSLCYLITSAFIDANADTLKQFGDYYHNGLKQIAKKYPGLIDKIEGLGHLSSLFFSNAGKAASFAANLNEQGIDISAHTYKENCAPSALTKLPLITTPPIIDFILNKMDETLKKM
jgi:acetylornithine/succinyldiaminopimelate/putrescine aminotransferase